MANEEHLEILKRGVEEWNEWRREHPEARPDLTGADLDGADLVGAVLDRANLVKASLVGAKLDRASLVEADLDRASLVGARLISTDFTSARLYRATLDRATLDCVDLTDANLGYTVVASIDLRRAISLESVKHRHPSPISIDTLELSQGQIPRAFLKGCGLSDWEIEAAKLWSPELSVDERTTIYYEIECIRGEQPINPFRVFISYTRNKDDEGQSDAPFVEALEKLLDSKGVRYWRDVHDLKAGRLERQIDRAIDLNPLVLLVLSERSVESDWVEWEASKARDLERRYRKQGSPRDVLCPVALDDAWRDCDWDSKLRKQVEKYNILDFSGWENDKDMTRQFAKLYEGLRLHYTC